MKELEKYRKEIDEIDTKIIKLYEERMFLVSKVIEIKKKENLSTLDSSREKIMLEKNLDKIENTDFKKYYKFVLEGFLKASKEFQEDKKD